MEEKIIYYKLGKCGTDLFTGAGVIGNIQILMRLIGRHNKKIYFDNFTIGKTINYDPDYEEESGIKNPFEYYFSPKFKLEENDIIYDQSRASYYHPSVTYGNFNLSYKNIYSNIRKIFFETYDLKIEIKNFIEDYVSKNFKGFNVLGINMRLTDFITANVHRGRNLNFFIKTAREIMRKQKIDKIFIATDNIGAIKIFEEQVKGIEILYLKDIFRAIEQNERRGLHEKIECNRKFHKYLLGEEAIKDTFILSKTDYLIKSHNAISDCAILLTETIKSVF